MTTIQSPTCKIIQAQEQENLPAHRLKNLCAAHERVWMGIINLSPKSFSVRGNPPRDHGWSEATDFHGWMASRPGSSLKQAENFVQKGAHILDIGAVPTNPSIANSLVDPHIELDTLYPALYALKKEFGSQVLFSVDTYSPTVARELARENLIDIVNDVYGGRKIEHGLSTLDVVSKFSLGCVLMHMSGELETLNMPVTQSVAPTASYLDSIVQFFQERKKALEEKGINFCIFDPGIGGGRFGKNLEQNLAILSEEFLQKLFAFNFPILIGLSRKSFLGELYPHLKTPGERDSVSKEWENRCFEMGVKIVRTHAL